MTQGTESGHTIHHDPEFNHCLPRPRSRAHAGCELLLRGFGAVNMRADIGARIAAGLCALTLGSAPAFCAELFYMDHDPFTGRFVGPEGPLVISGEIVPGDYAALLSKILADRERFLAQNKIILASDGGDVAEALKVARLVKSLYTQVIVGPLTGRCVSACFFIYAAAGEREADGERLIGINRPYLAAPEAGSASTAPADAAALESGALAKVRAFLADNAVPDYLLAEMFRRASDDAYWLSAEDLKNLGYRSPWYERYLRARCAWDDKAAIDDLKRMLKCRDQVTRAAARQALALAATALQTRAGSVH
jgi:hypothetical protein